MKNDIISEIISQIPNEAKVWTKGGLKGTKGV